MNAKKILEFALGPIASAAFGLITVPLIAWAFSVEDVGRMNMLQVTVSFCLLLLVLGLDQAYVREFHESRDRARLLKACFTPGFLLLLVSGLGTMVFSAKLTLLLFDTANPVFYWITLACVIATFIAKFLSLILRMQERGLAYSMSQVIPKALLLAIVGGIVLFGLSRSFLALQLAFLTSTIAVVLVYLWNTRKQWRPAIAAKLDPNEMRSLLKFGTPLIFSGLAYWGLVTTSSIALRSLSTFSELGVYSVTMSFAGVATIFQSIFSVVWAPIVYKWVGEGTDLSRVDDVAQQALAMVCGIFVVCGLFSWLTDYMLPAEYTNVKYLVLCAIVQPLLYTLSEVTCVGISISRRTMLTVWVTLTALFINVLLNLWLVPTYGAAGAVMSNAVAYVVFFVARTEASAHVWRQFPRTRLYVFVSLAVSFSLATVALAPRLPFHYALVWLALLPIDSWCFRAELLNLVAFGRRAWRNRQAA
jgi:O-antigen/teichoic acid export membrane protein